MSKSDKYEDLVRKMCRIAWQAGAKIMDHYESDVEVSHKKDRSPVTIADQDAEEIILAALVDVAPHIPIISEEAASGGHIPEVGELFFLVDPLDGTKEFLDKNGEFTVNIALIERGVAVAGVVYAPATQQMFFCWAAGGAYEQVLDPHKPFESGGVPKSIAARVAAPDGLVVIASRSHRAQKTDEYLAAYNVKEFLAAGSSLKFCLVARGDADLYPRHGRTMEWDTAAGHAVLAAAGGSVTELDGTPLTYGKKERGYDNPHFLARGAASAS